MSKKGFTLIEVLAVIIILGIIGAIIYPKITNTINNSEDNTYMLSAQGLVESLNSYVMDKKATLTPFSGCTYNFDTNVSDCDGFSYNGNLPTGGSVTVDSDGNVNGYVYFGEYKYAVNDNKASYSKVYAFDYIGKEQSLNIEKNGYYKLEVWGASGGNGNSTYIGGYGGYSVGYIYLESGTNLYINVGGKGSSPAGAGLTTPGGYNGGANSYVSVAATNNYGTASGGGASHISFKSGLLSSLSNDIDDILIVAGGGGGGSYDYYADNNWFVSIGGSGGGYIGGTAYGDTSAQGSGYNGKNYLPTPGGTQSLVTSVQAGEYIYIHTAKAGTFGQGGFHNSPVDSVSHGSGSGGGGGLYGGAGARNWAGGGGSGYIGNDQLIDKYMYCYNCSESSDISTRTISTTNVSNDAISEYAKSGHGYVIITYLDKYK